MKTSWLKIGFLILALGLSACSEQYRVTDPGADPAEINEILDRMQTQGSAVSSFDVNLLGDLRDDPTGSIFFTRSGTNGLFPESVFSIADVSPFIDTGSSRLINVFEMELSEVSIAFVDGVSSPEFGSGRHFALMIEFNFQDGGPAEYYVGISNPEDYVFSDEAFEVQFPGVNGETIVLRSYGVSEDFSDELRTNVKFDVWVIDNQGQTFQIGQFSALAGFGG